MALNPDFFDNLVQRTLEFQIPFIDKMLAAAGDRIDFFRIGDDFGTQNGLLVGPDMWRKHIQPALKAMAEVAKRHGAYYYQHSCGAVRDLIEDFIATGVDVLDPVQVKAKGMDLAALKRDFGKDLTFHGCFDHQQILPFGTVGEVRREVHRVIVIMAPGGGFCLAPSHDLLLDEFPHENVIAMYDEARRYGVYS